MLGILGQDLKKSAWTIQVVDWNDLWLKMKKNIQALNIILSLKPKTQDMFF